MWGRFVRLVLIGAAVSCAAPAGAVGVSSISVAVDAPVVSARIAVTVTMASDQVGTKRAYPLARVDDGRPCEPTWSAFTAATPPSQVRGLTESIAFAAGSTQARVLPTTRKLAVTAAAKRPTRSRSRALLSIEAFPSRKPVCSIRASVSVVLPWSTWAMIAIFLIS